MSLKPTYEELLQKVKALEKEKENWLKDSAVGTKDVASAVATLTEKHEDCLQEPGSLGSIIDIEELQSIMDDFYHLTGMVTAILDMNGTVIEATGWQDICTKFHRIHPETARNCTESDLYLVKHVKSGEYIEYRCKNGLRDVVTPLYIGKKHMGNIYTGQFFYDDEAVDEERFVRQAEAYGFAEDAYLEALHRVPRFSRDVIHYLMRFLVKFASYISNVSYAKIKLENEICERKREEEKAKRSERFLSVIIDNLPDVVFVKEAKDLRFVVFNKAGEDLTGYSRNEVIGKNNHDLFSKVEADIFSGKEQEVINRRIMVDIPEESIQTKSKGERILHTKKIPILNEEGRTEYILGISEDITKGKIAETALRESETPFRSIFDNANVGILVADLQGEHFYLANDTQCRMLGYDRDQLLSLGVKDLHPEDELPKVAEGFQRQTGNEISLVEDVPMLRSDGAIIYVDITSTSMVLDGRPCLLGLFTDVSKRREAEVELESHRHHLEELVEDRTQMLEAAIQSLVMARHDAKAANRKRRFRRWMRINPNRLSWLWMTLLKISMS